MAISITNIGTSQNTAGATLTLTTVTVPAGSLIFVCTIENTVTATAGVFSDAVNTYVAADSAQVNGSGSIVSCAHAINASLSSGTITYTKRTGGAPTGMSAFYATGIVTTSPFDTAVKAKATGASATPSVTSGTPGNSGELFVGVLGYGNNSAFTEDSGHSWAVPPNSIAGSTFVSIAGGSQVNAGSSAITFAPTIGTSGNWAAFTFGYLAATAQPFAKYDWPGTLLPPPDRSYIEVPDLARMAGAGAKPFAKYDWPITLPPPPPDRSFFRSTHILSLAVFPFAKYDWPLTQLPPPNRSFVYNIDLSVLAGAGNKPFAKQDWPLSVPPVLNPPGYVQSIDLSPLATAGARPPIAQYQWALTVPPPPDRSFIRDLNLSALAGAGAKPFAKYDWPLSILAVLNPPGFMQAVDLSALANAGLVPFAKYDWPLSVPPVLNPPGYTWSTSGPLIPHLGSGPRRPLFIESASGFPASYWPDGS